MTVPEIVGKAAQEIFSKVVPRTRTVGGKPLSDDIPVTLTGDSAITVTNTGTASAIGYSVAHNDSGVTAGSKGDTTNQTPGFGETFKVLSATVDAKGHVTVLEDHTAKIPDDVATQSAKGLMSPTDKKKLDTLIDSTLSNTGKAADAKATGDAIAYLRDYLKSMDVSRTASGNPATFSDAKAANVKELSVTITPTQSGSGDPSPTNIRPISGVSSVSVTRTGKNLLGLSLANFQARTAKGSWNSNTCVLNGITATFEVDANGWVNAIKVSGTATGGTFFQCANPMATLPAGDYIFSAGVSGGNFSSYLAYLENATGGGRYAVNGSVTFSESDNWKFPYFTIAVYSGNTVNLTFKPMIRRASDTDPTFEPYQGQTVAVQLTDGANPLTVYGGTLNVTTGKLTVTHGNIASYNGETVPDGWISSTGQLSTGAQVVYPLAAPVTYQLTPAQLATLSGYNAVSTDAASVSVTYKADTALVLGGG